MRRAIAIVAVAIAIVGSAIAAPKGRPHRKPAKADSNAGSAIAGSGSAVAPDAGSAAGSAVELVGSDALGSAASPPPTTTTVIAAPPAAGRTLAMRPKPSHDGFVDNMDCKACHTSAGWSISAMAGASGFDHDRTGFPLRGAHVQTTCTGCHATTSKPPSACEACHHDSHQGRLGTACAECHTAAAWNDTNTLQQHRRTRMPLTGRHATVDCVACHTRQRERGWSDVPVDCYACHRAEYHRTDVHPTHDGSTGAAQFPRDCGLCHQTAAWSPAVTSPTTLPGALARSDHDMYFTLTSGSHRTADCASCHADQRRMKLVRCDGCHNDIALRSQHDGATFARTAATCLRCHPRGAAR